MGIDLGGVFTINGVSGSQAFDIAGSSDLLNIDTTGRQINPNQIGFVAGCGPVDPGWIALTGAVWNIQTGLTGVTYNKGGGYNGSSRFTAPVAGSYFFHFSSYAYKPGAVQGDYCYTIFQMNGNPIGNFVLRGNFEPNGYSFDHNIEDLIYLNVGDYVEVVLLPDVAGFSVYRYHQIFSGFLVG